MNVHVQVKTKPKQFISIMDLDLDKYVAGPFTAYEPNGRESMNLVPVRDSFPEAACLLSLHTQHRLQGVSSS